MIKFTVRVSFVSGHVDVVIQKGDAISALVEGATKVHRVTKGEFGEITGVRIFNQESLVE